MAFGAVHFFPGFANVYRVLELEPLQRNRFLFAASLADDDVAGITLVIDDYSLFALMLTIVAAETPFPHEVADIIRIHIPLDAHIWEEVLSIDILYPYCSLLNCTPSELINVGIVLLIIRVNLFGDGLQPFFFGRVFLQ